MFLKQKKKNLTLKHFQISNDFHDVSFCWFKKPYNNVHVVQ